MISPKELSFTGHSCRVVRGSGIASSAPESNTIATVWRHDGESSGHRQHVLVVEDDPILRFGLENLVEQWGYAVLSAADVEEALNYASQKRMRFVAIITDYHLGNGMTGVEMLKELKQRAGRRIPALILTGETSRESLAAIVASGIDVAYKPTSEDELQRRFSRLLLAEV